LDCLPSSGAENTQRFGNTIPAGEQLASSRPAETKLKKPADRSQYQQRPASTPLPPVEALDMVAAAAAAVKLRDLAELRSFRNPPVVVCQVLEPLALLLGETDTRWVKMRKLLDGNLLGRLMSFDPSSLTPGLEAMASHYVMDAEGKASKWEEEEEEEGKAASARALTKAQITRAKAKAAIWAWLQNDRQVIAVGKTLVLALCEETFSVGGQPQPHRVHEAMKASQYFATHQLSCSTLQLRHF